MQPINRRPARITQASHAAHKKPRSRGTWRTTGASGRQSPEHPAETSGKAQGGQQSGAESGALDAREGASEGGAGESGSAIRLPEPAGGGHDPDLALVVAAWPKLPADVRAAVLALVNDALADSDTTGQGD